MLKHIIFAFLALSLLSGCAIHPVPEDVAGVDTYHIVRQIRCEAREALVSIIKEKLGDFARQGSSVSGRLLSMYESNPDAVADIQAGLFPGPEHVEVRSFIKLFADTAIAYTFDLTMTENNDLTTDVSFVKPITSPKFTLGINAGAKRKRSNQRTFTVADTFSYLVKQLNRPNSAGKHYCDRHVVQENYIYPIAGRIGVDQTIRTFMELTLLASLTDEKGGKGAGPPTMADKLTFTTAISISANPKIEFAPVTSAFRLASAGLNGVADRTDMHQVTVGLAIAASGQGEIGVSRSFIFSTERGPGVGARTQTAGRRPAGLFVGRSVTGAASTPAEERALQAIDQLKSRELQLIQPP
jgi:hypothetical protein